MTLFPQWKCLLMFPILAGEGTDRKAGLGHKAGGHRRTREEQGRGEEVKLHLCLSVAAARAFMKHLNRFLALGGGFFCPIS